MGRPARDITGLRIGMLTALKRVSTKASPEGNRPLWLIRCDCGKEFTSTTSDYTRATSTSCGCNRGKAISLKVRKHGLSRSKIYHVWDTMIARCHRKTHKSYKYYGGKGITVCERWRESFDNFYADMGSGYSEGLQLDRINNLKGYDKENCRWVTPIQQGNNKSTNRQIVTPAGVMNINEAARYFNIRNTTLLYRLAAGWSTDKLFLPVGTYINKKE